MSDSDGQRRRAAVVMERIEAEPMTADEYRLAVGEEAAAVYGNKVLARERQPGPWRRVLVQ